MIISKTPFRISFFGGGTDYPIWYREYGGRVLSTSINKYCYITLRELPPFFDHKYRISYSKFEHKKNINDIEHPSVKACLSFLKIKKGLEIHYDADLPARSGLGSSSSFTVGLLNCLYAYQGKMASKKQLTYDAIHVEQNIIGENVGSQDQTIAAHGGINFIEFRQDGEIHITPVCISMDRINELNNHCLLFFTGISRTASEIAYEQIKCTKDKINELNNISSIADDALKNLHKGLDIKYFGNLLHEVWNIKRSITTKISNSIIDNIYKVAMDAGAYGGKLLGAGGGGFILFIAEPERHREIKKQLSRLLYVPFKFEKSGTQIIYYNPKD